MSAIGAEPSSEERALQAYHDGALRGLSRWRFERRLAGSPELRRQLAQLREIARLAREADAAGPAPDLWDRIALHLPAIDAERAGAAGEHGSGAFWRPLFRPLAAAAATAALALALVLGIMGDGAGAAPGIISWMDTGGRSVVVLEGQGDATIVWVLGSPAPEGASRGGPRVAV